jgi:hypothetical protein
MTSRTIKLEARRLRINELLLDPNNPRFVQDLKLGAPVPDEKVESQQPALLRRFTLADDEDSEDNSTTDTQFFSIKDLTDSMTQIGFVSIDRVVVRTLRGSGRYLVIEGNRRISAAKRLLEADDRKATADDALSPAVRESLETISVLLLDTDGRSEDQIHADIGVVLGLRHYGQVLGWEPLPRAVNIFKEYMSSTPDALFSFSSKRVGEVAAVLSISRSEVKKALKTFIVYQQLSGEFNPGPKPTHYSLIDALVSQPRLAAHYFKQDANTYELSSDSLEKLYAIGELDTRDSSATEPIISEPKEAGRLGRIVADAYGHADPATRDFARGLLAEVESKQRTLDDAIDHLTSFSAARQWVEALNKLLGKQTAQLSYSAFSPVGNDRLSLDDAIKAFRNIRIILEV